MPDPVHRPTKKERKSLAHRERGKTKKALVAALDLDANGLPESEPGLDSNHRILPQNVDDPEGAIPVKALKQKKRKRDEVDSTLEAAADSASQKKPRLGGDDETGSDEEEASKPLTKDKKKYILFIGNLSYRTTRESIAQYFNVPPPVADGKISSKLPRPPAVRMLTKAATSKKHNDATSKGCAFVEFEGPGPLQRALKLDDTELDGRKLRVELTVGGGGKSDNRSQKLKTKNQKLRDKRISAQASPSAASFRPNVASSDGQRRDRRPTGPFRGNSQDRRGPRKPDRSGSASTGANAIVATRQWGAK